MGYLLGPAGCCKKNKDRWITLRKYGQGGNVIFDRDHGADCYCVAVDSDGNIYTGGEPNPFDGNTIRKYNATGTLQLSIATPGGAAIFGVAVDDDGNIYATGPRAGGVTTHKILTDGSIQFSLDHGADTYCIAVKGSYFYVGGKRAPGDAVDGSTFYQFAKYDLDGNVIWRGNNGSEYPITSPQFGGTGNSYVRALFVDDDENVYISGHGAAAEAVEIAISGTATGGSFDLSFNTIKNEKQQISITGSPTGGFFTLRLGAWSTGGIPYNATKEQVQTQLNALLPVYTVGGYVTCSGGPFPSNPIVVEFHGGLAETNVNQITNPSTFLTGGTSPAVSIQTLQDGEIGAESLATVTIPFNATAGEIAAALKALMPSSVDQAYGFGGPLPNSPCTIYISLGDFPNSTGHPFPRSLRFPTDLDVAGNSIAGGGSPEITCLDRGKFLGSENASEIGLTKFDSNCNLLQQFVPPPVNSIDSDPAGVICAGLVGGFRKYMPTGALIYTSPTPALVSYGIATDSDGSVFVAGSGAVGGGSIRKWSSTVPASLLWQSIWTQSSKTSADYLSVWAANDVAVDSDDNAIAVGIRIGPL